VHELVLVIKIAKILLIEFKNTINQSEMFLYSKLGLMVCCYYGILEIGIAKN
jgi:hypothetical protein